MYYPSGTVRVWKGWIEWGHPLGRSIVTAHFVARNPYGPIDDVEHVIDQMWNSYGNFVEPLCCVSPPFVLTHGKLVNGDTTGTHEDRFYFSAFNTFINQTCAEASFIIRRVGAGTSKHAIGRCRFGPLDLAVFTDAPRYRHVDNLDARIQFNLNLLQSGQTHGTTSFDEVLYDRISGDCLSVTTYTVPTRTGRVWQRAGYPQGRRGVGP